MSAQAKERSRSRADEDPKLSGIHPLIGRAIPIALLIGGIALAAFGALRGELPIALATATNICFQCIGLG